MMPAMKRQNAQTFREKTGAFRKIPFVKKNAELVFITAPNRVPPLQDDSNTDDTPAEDQDQRGWWFSRSREYYKAVDYSDSDLGFDESMEVVKQTFKEQGPFDGVLAFSQGASLLSILCAKREQDPGGQFQFNFAVFIAGFKSRQSPHKCYYDTTISIPTLHVIGETDRIIVKGGQFQFNFAVFIAGFKSRQSPHKCYYDTTISIPTLHVIGETDRIIVKGGQFQFNFAVFIAGFKSRQSPHKCYYDTTISIPTLHVIGETDRIIVKEMSQELLQLYTNAKVIEHPGGHFIPATGPPKQEFTSFFNDMFEAKKSNNT